MAKAQAQQQDSSLMDFNFDDDSSFFGVKPGAKGSTIDDTIQDVKSGASKLDETDTDEEVSKKSKSKAKSEVEAEEDLEEDEVTFFGEEEDTKPAKGGKPKPEDEDDDSGEENEEEEDEDDNKEEDEEDEEEGTEKSNKQAKKKDTKQKDEAPDDQSDEEFFTTLAKEMKEKGIFQNVQIKEGETIPEEKFLELQDAEIEARVEETFQAFFEELDDDGKDFLKFKKNGGKTADFLATYSSGVDLSSYDEESEAARQAVLTHYLTTVEKLDAEELKDRLTYIKDTGKEKVYANKYHAALTQSEEEARKTLVENQEKLAKLKEKQTKEFNASLNDLIAKTESVGVFKITEKEQKELGNYFTKPTVKVGKNKYIPEFNRKLSQILRAETPEDKKNLILLGKLFKNDFNVAEDLITEAETKVTKKVKSKLRQAKQGHIRASGSSATGKKSIADFFDTE